MQTTSAAEAPAAAAGPGRSAAAALRPTTAVGFVVPAVVVIGVFLILPAVWTLLLGASDYRLTGLRAAEPQYVGLGNVTQALGDPDFWQSLRVTLVFVLGSAVIGQAMLGFTLAWVLRDWTGWVRHTVETLVILAWIIPSSVVAFLWIAYLDGESGTLNSLLGLDVEWLLRRPLLSIVVFNTWRGTAFSMLLFSAALKSLPPSRLETARVAGASTFQQLRDIVLPGIRGHVLTNLLLISLWTFNDFTPFLITGGGPAGATRLLPIFIYENALRFFELGYGAALSAILLVVNLIVALGYIGVARRSAT